MTNGTQFTLPLTSAYTACERDLLTAFGAADRPPFMVVHWADSTGASVSSNLTIRNVQTLTTLSLMGVKCTSLKLRIHLKRAMSTRDRVVKWTSTVYVYMHQGGGLGDPKLTAVIKDGDCAGAMRRMRARASAVWADVVTQHLCTDELLAAVQAMHDATRDVFTKVAATTELRA